ncbi:unnamed protein product [Amaranthus hypochondriacus]
MGNCTSCVSSDIQVHEYGCLDNAVHIRASINGCYKVGSVHSQKGAKSVNQDSAILYQGYGREDGAFCAVFDGHGINGQLVSRIARYQLPTILESQMKVMDGNEAFVSSFKAIDKEIKLIDNIDCSLSGSTAVVVVQQGEELIVANLGDSRAVLGTLTENRIEAVPLTKDMKPDVEEEADRIKKAKGRVFAHKSQPHILRVWLPDEDVPGLAMTRAFGDFDLKSYGIIATPEVTRHRITSNDLFLVLACDGVWDVLSNDEVVSVVCSVKNKETAAKAIVDEALAAWNRKFPSANVDDCTAVCLFLQDTKNDLFLPPAT